MRTRHASAPLWRSVGRIDEVVIVPELFIVVRCASHSIRACSPWNPVAIGVGLTMAGPTTMAAGWKGRRPGTSEPEVEGTTTGSARYISIARKHKPDNRKRLMETYCIHNPIAHNTRNRRARPRGLRRNSWQTLLTLGKRTTAIR